MGSAAQGLSVGRMTMQSPIPSSRVPLILYPAFQEGA